MNDSEIQQRAAKYENALENRDVLSLGHGLENDASCHSRDEFNKITEAWKQINEKRHAAHPELPTVDLVHDVDLGPIHLGNVNGVDVDANGFKQQVIDKESIQAQQDNHAKLFNVKQGTDPIEQYSDILSNDLPPVTNGGGNANSVLDWARHPGRK